MRIQSEDGYDFIELIQLEVDVSNYPSTCVQIEGRAHGFSGLNSRVWLSADDMQHFLTELVRLEQLREGSASLVSMSPDEAVLSLQTVDRAGHMIARLDLTRLVYGYYAGWLKQRLSITFEIDVSLLPGVLRQFEQLIPRDGKEPGEKNT